MSLRHDVGGRRVVAGTVWVNCFFVRDLRAPFGASWEPGIGGEGGSWSTGSCCDAKAVVFAPAARAAAREEAA